MRRTLMVLLGLALAVPAAARAQTFAVDRGSWLVGGTAGWSSRASDGEDGRDVIAGIAPSVQRFVVPGLGVGVDLTVTRSHFTGSPAVMAYGAGPTATYYFGRGARSFYPYVGGSVLVMRLHASASGPGPDLSGSSTAYRPYAGMLTMLGRQVGLDTRLYFERDFADNAFQGNSSAYGMAVGVSAFVF